MTSKDIKKYGLIVEIACAKTDADFGRLFAELCAIDFSTAFEMWEYKLLQHQGELGNIKVAEKLERDLFAMFHKASETKTRSLFCESLPLNKLVYGSITAATGTNLSFLVNLILSNKIDFATNALNALKSNATAGFDYGDAMKRVVDGVFTTYCREKGVIKCELNRKQSALLLEYISKIKGPHKMLLTQRIKEL